MMKGEFTMSPRNDDFYKLPALMKIEELKVRQVADEYAFSVDEYYSLLGELLALAPDVEPALNMFVNRNGDKEGYRILEKASGMLQRIGCELFVEDIYSLLDAYEKGNWRLAAVHAERVADEFGAFITRIKKAKTRKGDDGEEYGNLTIMDYISLLEREDEERKLVILAVDDSVAVLNSITSVLGGEYKVFTLPKSTELEKVLEKLTPDLFLLDYLMPGINGLELVPIIRGFEEHMDTPIIFLTSEGTIDTVTAATALGACDFAVKPFAPDVLREKIAKHIVRKKSF